MSNKLKKKSRTMKKKTQQSLTPKLRFPEFRDTPEWVPRQLEEYLTESRIKGSTGDKARKLTVKLWGKGVFEKKGARQGSKSTQYYKREAGQFIYSKLDFLNQAFAVIPDHLDGVESTVDLPCFDVSEELNSQFLLEYVQRKVFYKKLGEIADGGRKARRIQVEMFLSFPVYLPPQSVEQDKIADCLSSLDDLIAAEDRKLAALRDHKNGLMQQLFPRKNETQPHLRFPEFKDAPDWVSRMLDELAERGTGHTPDKKKSAYYNGGIRWVSLADSKRLDNGLIFETKTMISELGISNSSAVLHPPGSVILSRDAGVGKSAVLGTAMAVSQHFIAWRCDSLALSNWFLYYLLQRMKKSFEQIAIGSTIKTIGLPFFKAMRVTIPSLTEQKMIADCLSTLDDQITAQADKIESLKAHKKGLMQQLFPNPEDNQ